MKAIEKNVTYLYKLYNFKNVGSTNGVYTLQKLQTLDCKYEAQKKSVEFMCPRNTLRN